MNNTRDYLIEAIQREVIGPDPHPTYTDADTNEELLLLHVHGSPKSRYGAALLYPQKYSFQNTIKVEDKELEQDEELDKTKDELKREKIKGAKKVIDDDTTNDAVGLANQFLPSAMGFTIHTKNDPSTALLVTVKSAYYEEQEERFPKFRVNEQGEPEKVVNPTTKIETKKPYWIRRPIKIPQIKLNISDLAKLKGNFHSEKLKMLPNDEEQTWLELRVYNRTPKGEQEQLVLTFSLVNTVKADTNHRVADKNILYQNELEVEELSPGTILPYKERYSENDGEEEAQMTLLYRKKRIYGIGHGCAVQWQEMLPMYQNRKITSTFLPVYELPPVKPTVEVKPNMYHLSDLGDWEEGKKSLFQILEEYKGWIQSKEEESSMLGRYKDAAQRNITACWDNYHRIAQGVNLLTNAEVDSDLVKCFRWMNHAMIWQQQRSKTAQRLWKLKGSKHLLEDLKEGGDEHPSLLEFQKDERKGRWRPFQLAFVLMNLNAAWNPDHKDREIVDLIWFPTGGGKTEAYLGLAAFSIFARRIRGTKGKPHHFGGTAVLMRYTLRLLTTQQFERASSLICACDLIRKDNLLELGSESISIGLWAGNALTPNKRNTAVNQYKELTQKTYAPYNFVILKCPCCGAQMGKLDKQEIPKNKRVALKGIYKNEGKNASIYFACENKKCDYKKNPLPLYVIDEDIYEKAPTLVFGTVDKFAMIPWKIEAGGLFGFREEKGKIKRICPPELIIQDELHLISGPLGTMVGLYETMIQTLCNDYQRKTPPFYPDDIKEQFIPPKIVASSATISRAKEQVKALYGEVPLNIFPPQGLEFGNTWFSEEKDTKESPGRKYLGILAPGFKSGQTTVVRIYASILQQINTVNCTQEEKDYYWTLLGFFNSIRELGIAHTLIFADLKEYMKSLFNRKLIPWGKRRYIRRLKEMTSRVDSNKIPRALKDLEMSYTDEANKAMDVCLATNMIATGVDVSRLGLIAVHGQPKTTAEYIQASSRVGRDDRGPGLVLTLYSPSKPRDKSQYEHFQGYHSRIYSYVEPTSVTPFSINARYRALHAIAIGLVRHFASSTLRKNAIHRDVPEFEDLKAWVTALIAERCQKIDPNELDFTLSLLKEKFEFWEKGYNKYGDAANLRLREGKDALMYANSQEISDEMKDRSLATPTSMRGVDKECNLSILKH